MVMASTPLSRSSNSIRSRHGPASGAPLLLFGEPQVLAKAAGLSRLGLVLRKILDKNGLSVSRWMRPTPKPTKPEPPVGSKAWLDKRNAAFGPTTRPAADAAALALSVPPGKLSLENLKQALGAIYLARSNMRIPFIERQYLLPLWFELYSRGVNEGLIKVKNIPDELIEMGIGAMAYDNGHSEPFDLSGMARESKMSLLSKPIPAMQEAEHLSHAPPIDHPVEIDLQHMLRHLQIMEAKRQGGYGMRFREDLNRPPKKATPQAKRVRRQRDYALGTAGRHGTQPTRHHNEGVAQYLERHGFQVVGGAGRGPEERIPGPVKGNKGSRFVDVTAKRGKQTIRVQTVSTKSDGKTPTKDEAAAAEAIRTKHPNDTLYLIAKNQKAPVKSPRRGRKRSRPRPS